LDGILQYFIYWTNYKYSKENAFIDWRKDREWRVHSAPFTLVVGGSGYVCFSNCLLLWAGWLVPLTDDTYTVQGSTFSDMMTSTK
jgi:hypothetical protein